MTRNLRIPHETVKPQAGYMITFNGLRLRVRGTHATLMTVLQVLVYRSTVFWTRFC